MLKKKIFLIFFLVVGVLSSCKKDKYDADKQMATDDGIIKEFITKNSIVAVKHSSGIYYQVLSPGAGVEVTNSDIITVSYEGRLLNGNVFDKSTSYTSRLGVFITGWQIGIPLIKKGGKIRLLIPSPLAYKNQSPGAGIPENAVLDFTVELLNVQ